MQVVTEGQLAYLAGLIDGDGSIAFYRNKSMNSYAPKLRVCSNDPTFLGMLQLTYGGKVYRGGVSAFNNNAIYELVFTANQIRTLLPQLIPFLILKQRQAELLMRALDITKNHRFRGYDPSGLPEIVAEIKALKHMEVSNGSQL